MLVVALVVVNVVNVNVAVFGRRCAGPREMELSTQSLNSDAAMQVRIREQ